MAKVGILICLSLLFACNNVVNPNTSDGYNEENEQIESIDFLKVLAERKDELIKIALTDNWVTPDKKVKVRCG